jgi:hypothetical protein
MLESLRKSPYLIPLSQPVLSRVYQTNKSDFLGEIGEALVSERIQKPEILYALLYYAGCFENGDINSPLLKDGGTVLHLVARYDYTNLIPFFAFFCEKGADLLRKNDHGVRAAETASVLIGRGPEKVRLMRAVNYAARGNPEALKHFRSHSFDLEFLRVWVFELGQDFTWLDEPKWDALVADIIDESEDDFMFWINCYIQCGAISSLMRAPRRARIVDSFKPEYGVYRMALSAIRSAVHAQLSRVKEFAIPLRKLVLDYLGVVTLLSDGVKYSVASIEVTEDDTDPSPPVIVYQSSAKQSAGD